MFGSAVSHDLELASLLCTRLCHDLAGPVGAVTAGVELLGDETDPAFIGETVALLRHSADASSHRLKFLRAAFGVAGRTGGTGSTRSLVEAYVQAVGGDVALEWRQDVSGVTGHPEAIRLLLNLCLAGLESLSNQGTLVVEVHEGAPDADAPSEPATGYRFAVIASGPRAAIDPAVRAALQGERDGLVPRTAQAYLLYRLALPGGGLIIEETPGRVLLAAGVPAASP